MTVSSEVNKVSYAGNGSTTDFSTSFVFLDDSHLLVTLVVDATGGETTQTITTHYTLTGAGTGSAGTVTMLTAPASGETLIVSRSVPLTQGTDYVESDPFPAESHEEALDKLTMINQQQQEELSRSLRFPLSVDSGVSNEIPTPTAGQYLKFNSAGTAIESITLAENIAEITYENLDANGDVGTTAGTVAIGNHLHTGVYEPVLTAASQAEMEAGTETALRSMSPLRVKQAIDALSASSGHGQCYLTKSGANLLLSPKDGNTLLIDGVAQTIPSAGVTLAPPATSGTTYFIYVYMNAGTMTLEASATAHATDSTTGVEIKSGDSTRSLVGMARTVSSAWVDSATQRFVISYFNRKDKTAVYNLGSSRSTASGSYAITNAADICEYLTWADEGVLVSGTASIGSSATNTASFMYPSIDTSALNNQQCTTYTWATSMYVNATITTVSLVAEGYHYSALYFASNGAATTTVQATYSSIAATVKG